MKRLDAVRRDAEKKWAAVSKAITFGETTNGRWCVISKRESAKEWINMMKKLGHIVEKSWKKQDSKTADAVRGIVNMAVLWSLAGIYEKKLSIKAILSDERFRWNLEELLKKRKGR